MASHQLSSSCNEGPGFAPPFLFIYVIFFSFPFISAYNGLLTIPSFWIGALIIGTCKSLKKSQSTKKLLKRRSIYMKVYFIHSFDTIFGEYT